jgi:hypothetical protein
MASFALRNLRSTDVSLCEPWLFTAQGLPAGVAGKEGKKNRDDWINDPTTEWQVYSFIEGLNPHVRVSKDSGDMEGNPPLKLHALVGDYDAPVTDEELQVGLARMGDKLPNYFERTLSGNCRFIWLFEQAITVPSRDFMVALLAYARRTMKADMLAVGLDTPAWEEPGRYYTNSGVWKEITTKRLPLELVQGWVFEVAKKYRWKSESGIEVPLPVAWAEIQRKWPMNNWPTSFELESQGPTFWVPESSSPKSAIVKTSGIYTFSQHAHKPFFSWQDLLGAEFCEEYRTKNLGKAVEGIYHDGTRYFRRDGLGSWRAFTKEDTASHLQIGRGLGADRYKGAPSEVDEALEYLRHWQAIDGAAPCAFQGAGLFTDAGPRILNTHTRTVILPLENPVEWGPTGSFPWLSAYFDYLFEPFEQKEFFLAWLRRFYQSAYERKLTRGQNVFLVGSPGTGKTLLSQRILSRLMGGSCDAQSYLLGETGFNSQLFEVALWTVDDNSSSINAMKHATFSNAVKKMSANSLFEYNAKFRVAVTVPWQGRVFVTANDDEESLRIIPDLEISSLEKTMLFRTTKKPYDFPISYELEATISRELPSFARWLLDWTPPAETQGSARYGVKEYHEKSLLRQAEYSSRSNSFSEILDDWATDWFRDHPKSDFWEGTAYQLYKAFSAEEDRRAATKNLTTDSVSRQLSALKAKGHRIEAADTGGTRVWKIFKDFKK